MGYGYDANLLADTVSGIDDRPYTLLAGNAAHLLPRHEDARVRCDRIEDHDDLVLLLGRVLVEARGHWRNVRELDVSILLLDLPELRAEHLHDLCMRKWEVVLDVQHDGPRLLRAICEVTNRV